MLALENSGGNDLIVAETKKQKIKPEIADKCYEIELCFVEIRGILS